MLSALVTIGRAARDTIRSLPMMIFANLLWLAFSLTIVLFPFATAGLYTVTNRIAYKQKTRLADFIAGGRGYLGPSLRWTLINLTAFGAIYVTTTYDPVEKHIPTWLQGMSVLAGIAWAALQFYVWPFLMEQPNKRVRAAVRNAMLLGITDPIYTLTLLSSVGFIVWLSLRTSTPIGIFMMSFIALLGNRAIIERLAAYGRSPEPDNVFRFQQRQ